MLDLYVAADLAVKGTRALAWSALPDAPVLPDPAPRERDRFTVRTRARTAAFLHRVASVLEPQRRETATGQLGATPACR